MVNVGTCLRAILAYTLPWLLVCLHVATEPHSWHGDATRSQTGADGGDHRHADHDAPSGGHSVTDHTGSAVCKAGSARLSVADPEPVDRMTEPVPTSEAQVFSAPNEVELRVRTALTAARTRGRSPPRA